MALAHSSSKFSGILLQFRHYIPSIDISPITINTAHNRNNEQPQHRFASVAWYMWAGWLCIIAVSPPAINNRIQRVCRVLTAVSVHNNNNNTNNKSTFVISQSVLKHFCRTEPFLSSHSPNQSSTTIYSCVERQRTITAVFLGGRSVCTFASVVRFTSFDTLFSCIDCIHMCH